MSLSLSDICLYLSLYISNLIVFGLLVNVKCFLSALVPDSVQARIPVFFSCTPGLTRTAASLEIQAIPGRKHRLWLLGTCSKYRDRVIYARHSGNLAPVIRQIVFGESNIPVLLFGRVRRNIGQFRCLEKLIKAYEIEIKMNGYWD